MSATSSADGDVGGMPQSTESGVRAHEDEEAGSPTGGSTRAPASAGLGAASTSPSGSASASDPASTTSADVSPSPVPIPAPQGPYRKSDAEDLGSDDGPLESLGKAISSPVQGAVDDQALPDAKPPEEPPFKPAA